MKHPKLRHLAGYKVIQHYQRKAQEQQVPQQPQQATTPSMGERPRNQKFQGPSGHWFITTQIADEAGRPTGRWHTHPTDPPNAPAETSKTEQPKPVENPRVGASRKEQQASKRKVVNAKKMEQGLKLLRADTLTDERVNQVASLLGNMKIDELEKLHSQVAKAPVHRKAELVEAIFEKLKADGVKEDKVPKGWDSVGVDTNPEIPPRPPSRKVDTLGRVWKDGELTDEIEGATSKIGKRIQGAKHIHKIVDEISQLPDDKATLEALREDLGEEARNLFEQFGDNLWDEESESGAERHRYNQLQGQIRDLLDRQYKITGERYHSSEKTKEKAKELLSLPEDKRTKVWQVMPKSVDPLMKARLLEGEEWLNGFVGKGPNGEDLDEFEITQGKVSRAQYRADVHTIDYPELSPVTTVIHELGHGIERRMEGALGASFAFLRHRTKGETPSKLNEVYPGSGYEDNEYGSKDKFDLAFPIPRAYYVGKQYNDATELISMGAEMLYSDPVGFCKKDPEYATFVIGILHGDLRDNLAVE